LFELHQESPSPILLATEIPRLAVQVSLRPPALNPKAMPAMPTTIITATTQFGVK
jgi:hypothetical protein